MGTGQGSACVGVNRLQAGAGTGRRPSRALMKTSLNELRDFPSVWQLLHGVFRSRRGSRSARATHSHAKKVQLSVIGASVT